MALVVVLLVVLAASIMVAFVTRMGLAAHQRSIELLHMLGAQDSYVARQFQNHALRFGLRGGLIGLLGALPTLYLARLLLQRIDRSEEHTSDLQSLMRISYAVFCLQKKKQKTKNKNM